MLERSIVISVVQMIFCAHYQCSMHDSLARSLHFTHHFIVNHHLTLTQQRIVWQLIKNRTIRLGMSRKRSWTSHFVQTTIQQHICTHVCICMCVNIGLRTSRVSECSIERLLAYGGGLRDSGESRVDLGLTQDSQSGLDRVGIGRQCKLHCAPLDKAS